METTPVLDAPDPAELFNFTTGRFRKNEEHELAIRHQVVAKIPNPNAGQPHFTVASEVATMKFVSKDQRAMSNVPALLAEETPIGAEYILMEKMEGVELEEVWPEMEIEDRLEVVKAVAAYQLSWASVSFEQYGFTEAYRTMFDDGRDGLDFDRGPWNSLEDYHAAIGKREIACIQQISELPPSDLTLRGPGLYQPTREKKIAALECYLKLLKYLLPTDQIPGFLHISGTATFTWATYSWTQATQPA
ncbi:hypothetical protein E4U44_005606 [Claviceps purpurea]|nr:hypothetical protein E4U44_005606 [Claviceps purpurea]